MAEIDTLLKTMVNRNASDLHLTSGLRPYLREHGEMIVMDHFPIMTPDYNFDLIMEIAPEANKRQYEDIWDTDFAYAIEGVGRFRVNIFRDRFGIGSVIRLIPSKVPTFEQLNLPQVLRDFCFLSKGLVLVTGPTGSGKSTTLAAMIDFINRNRSDHIITIEDPIEFVHSPKRCLLNQREVHTHTKSFPSALRAALREDPDIVLVGELRDLETMEIAIETAETGHLVFGTLHTNTAASTIDRMIDKYPANRQNQIRTMLAGSLKGVVAQTLLKKKNGGRVAAFEILVVNNAVSSNIREGKTHMIPSTMQVGKALGMCMFNDSLFELVAGCKIEPCEAYLKSTDKDSLIKKFKSNGIEFDPSQYESNSKHSDEPPAVQPQDYGHMITRLNELLASNPNDVEALNNLAWIYSTNPNARYRNGAEAIRLAERAREIIGIENSAILDTLSTAYAEAGRFDMALSFARRGLELAQGDNDPALIHQLTKAISLYEQQRPVRID